MVGIFIFGVQMKILKTIKKEWTWLSCGEKTFLTLVIGMIVLAILAVAGYVQNIFKLAGLLLTDQPIGFTSEILIRIIGIFPPVGSIVGWF